MKVSLWHQFSSNHSAAFSIVGTFESAEWAQEVAHELTEMLLDTQQWDETPLQDNPAALKQELRYVVSMGTTWMRGAQHMRRAVTVIDRFVFVTDHPGYSNFDGTDRAMMHIMRELGGQVVASLETVENCLMTLQCTAPDEEKLSDVINSLTPRKGFRDIYYYGPKKEPGYISGAQAIKREGQTLTLEGINISSSGFSSLFEWIDYLRSYQCGEFKIQLYGSPSEADISGWISISSLDVQQPFWAQFPSWADYGSVQSALAQFETASRAQEVADILRSILRGIHEWIIQNPEQAQWVWKAFWERLSPPEHEMQQLYGISWRYSLVGWMYPAMSSGTAEDIITVIGKTILLSNRNNHWNGIEPFPDLLKHFGAPTLYIHTKWDEELWFDLEVIGFNQDQSQQIAEQLSQNDHTVLPPWYQYYGGIAHDEQWHQEAGDALTYQKQALIFVEQWMENQRKHRSQRETSSTVEPSNDMMFPHVLKTQYATTYQRIQEMRFMDEKHAVQKNGLSIKRIRFWYSNTYQGLLALAAWLRSFGGQVTVKAYPRSVDEKYAFVIAMGAD